MKTGPQLPRPIIQWTSFVVSTSLLASAFALAPLRALARAPRKSKTNERTLNPSPPQPQRSRQPAPRDAGKKVDQIPSVQTPAIANLPSLDEVHSRKDKMPAAPAPIPSTLSSPRKIKSKKLLLGESTTKDEDVVIVRSHHARTGSPLRAIPQGGASNVALNKPTTQSSTLVYNPPGDASHAVDGNTDGNYFNGSVTHTNGGYQDWWRVDLGAVYAVQSVEVWNRTDCCSDRLTNFNVVLLDSNEGVVSSVNIPGQGGTPTTVSISGSARYVKVQLVGIGVLSLAEVKVWGTPTGGASASERAMARLDPFNNPGNQLQARDCEWSLPLVSLPGRAGLDLGLTLSYSSMVWTPVGSYIYFDEDNGNPSPGFHLGFPTLGAIFYDTQANVNARIMVTSSGRRVEFRYAGHDSAGGFDLYKTGDSSYAELLDYSGSILLRATDGTNLNFVYSGTEWHATWIRDRNGNKITAVYSNDDLMSVTDTLGRLINFNYDTNTNLNSITQTWNGQTHTWATFGWERKSFTPSFSLIPLGSYTNIPVLNQVGLADGSYYKFEYNNFGQVKAIRRNTSDGDPGPTGDVERSSITYDYPTSAGADCPRITASHVTAENWQTNVITTFEDLGSGWHRVITPDGTEYRELYATSGWQRGLTQQSEVWTGGGVTRQKWTTTSWTQENPSLSYQLNPRVTETNVYDAGGNRRRVTIDYSPTAYAQFGLPYYVAEYANDGTTELRRTYTDYNLSQQYLDWHIIGLVSAVYVVDVSNGWQWGSKTSYGYDAVSVNSQATTSTQHDQYFNTSYTVRANLTSVSRWDITDIDNSAKALTTQIRYDAAGSALSVTDAAGHQNQVSYGDAFSDNTNHNTFAYPTTVTDADNYSSSVQYNYDFGATTRTQNPIGAVQAIT